MSLKEKVLATMKSRDTESDFELYVTRTPGYLWALLFRALHVHPIAVTLMSIVIGAAAGYFFYFDDLRMNLIGMALLVWANWYDCADGQLARMTGKKTLIGRILDGFAGDVWFFFIYCAVCLRLMPQQIPGLTMNWGVWIWVLGIVAGFLCHVPQASLADYYRQIHLLFLLGKEGSELDTYAEQHRICEQLPRRGALLERVFHGNYQNYCKSQEQRTPEFQRFYARVKERFSGVENLPADLRQRFLQGSRPLMPITNILSFNTRAIVIYATCLLNCPWMLFLVDIVVFNTLYIYMHAKHERLCKSLEF